MNNKIKSKNKIENSNFNGLYSEEFEKDACGIGLIYSGTAESCIQTVPNALEMLKKLAHRSALGADGKTSDGSGILMQISADYFKSIKEVNESLTGELFAIGMLFYSKNETQNNIETEKKKLEYLAEKLNFKVKLWRKVPVDSSVLGVQAKFIEPDVLQVFIQNNEPSSNKKINPDEFEKRIYILKQLLQRKTEFDIVSFSSKTIVYKGLSQPEDLGKYYLDLQSDKMICRFAMVHSRFSTNTLPSWRLAQPFSLICHNGEINTLKGNLNWLRARSEEIINSLCKTQPEALTPLVLPGQSDSKYLDDMVGIFQQAGNILPKTLMTLMPEPWDENSQLNDAELKAFYEFQAPRMEPWDGPAAICFSDGDWIGAKLDRNGLRPCRFQILDDGTLILSSEIGVLDIANERVKNQGRLGPGQMIAVDIKHNKIFLDSEIKKTIALAEPFKKWLEKEQFSQKVFQKEIPRSLVEEKNYASFFKKLIQFGYSREELELILIPMLLNAEEAHSSMGNDTPLAILSEKPQLLFNYFRQMFAQVTNPPMDPIREKLVMSLSTFLGPKPRLFNFEEGCRKIGRLDQPVLSKKRYQSLTRNNCEIKTSKISTLYKKSENFDELSKMLDKVCEDAEKLANQQQGVVDVLVLTDEGVDATQLAIPSLLSLSAVHHHLIRKNLRTKVSLVVASHEVRDVHHFACLLGYGAEAVHPFMMDELTSYLSEANYISSANDEEMEDNYIKAINKGLLKIISKMGISTLQSYCGAQVFEIIGLNSEIVDKYFTGTVSRVQGLSMGMLAKETLLFQDGNTEFDFLNDKIPSLSALATGGIVHYREGEEAHLWNPKSISDLQIATRNKDQQSFQKFSSDVEKNSKYTLRGFIKLKSDSLSVPLSEVEPVNLILRRFTTGAMSLGALGEEVHESLAIAMNRIQAKSNSGEGGEDFNRFLRDANGDSRNSAIKQVASARFGVTAHYLANAVELQIKMAQGAKPGEGGQLPGHKVDQTIAGLRHSTPGVTLISPPPHHDIYSIEDLSQLIYDLKKSNPLARISVKLVAEAGIGTVAAGVAKALADKIVISGDCGGTGASPYSSIRYAGIPWEMGLAETHQTLVRNGLRDRVVLETDGQLKTGLDVAKAILLGAEEFGFSTAPLIVQGCIMMRKCHLNTCPVGIATQDPVLRSRFNGQPEYVINYFHFVAEELRQIMSQLGFRTVAEMIGQTQNLEFSVSEEDVNNNWKLAGLKLDKLIEKSACQVKQVKQVKQTKQVEGVVALKNKGINEQTEFQKIELDLKRISEKALLNREKVSGHWTIKNTQRSLGINLSYEVVKKYGAKGLPEDTINMHFDGVAGQSFGAFLAKGITFRHTGSTNDYVGKGLSGGRIIISCPVNLKQTQEAAPLALVGNTCLYGATSGEVYISGSAGERFAVRNSGVKAVVEGVGDHGCEYMTGGEVIILGAIGKNFAAGMSGGVSYVFAPDFSKNQYQNFNLASVELIWELNDEEVNYLKTRITTHGLETQSILSEKILRDWSNYKKHFIKILPVEYGMILKQKAPETEKKKWLTTGEVEHV